MSEQANANGAPVPPARRGFELALQETYPSVDFDVKDQPGGKLLVILVPAAKKAMTFPLPLPVCKALSDALAPSRIITAPAGALEQLPPRE